MELESKTLRTADGAEIHYGLRRGDRPWVLLHGLGCDARMWNDVADRLPGSRGLLVPDLRGHGKSTLGWHLPDVERWARDVAEIVEFEALERPAVAGLSLGGYTAMAMAALRPGLARGYGFVSTRAGADGEAGLAGRIDGLTTLRRRGWRSYAAGLMSSLLSEAHPKYPKHRSLLMEMFGQARESGLTWALIALANRVDRLEGLSGITVPVHVVVGDADALAPPSEAKLMDDALPASKLVVLPNVAHMSAMEAPDEVAAALSEL